MRSPQRCQQEVLRGNWAGEMGGDSRKVQDVLLWPQPAPSWHTHWSSTPFAASALCSLSSLLLYLPCPLPGNACSFSEARLKCHLFYKTSCRIPTLGEGRRIKISLIGDSKIYLYSILSSKHALLFLNWTSDCNLHQTVDQSLSVHPQPLASTSHLVGTQWCLLI